MERVKIRYALHYTDGIALLPDSTLSSHHQCFILLVIVTLLHHRHLSPSFRCRLASLYHGDELAQCWKQCCCRRSGTHGSRHNASAQSNHDNGGPPMLVAFLTLSTGSMNMKLVRLLLCVNMDGGYFRMSHISTALFQTSPFNPGLTWSTVMHTQEGVQVSFDKKLF